MVFHQVILWRTQFVFGQDTSFYVPIAIVPVNDALHNGGVTTLHGQTTGSNWQQLADNWQTTGRQRADNGQQRAEKKEATQKNSKNKFSRKVNI